MLIMVYLGIKLRGDTVKILGLTFEKPNRKGARLLVLRALLVLVLGIVGFVLGSIVMANITGIPESSDMSGYDYLQNNFGMLLLTLAGVYIVSSFGEEVIYRGFLINRIKEL